MNACDMLISVPIRLFFVLTPVAAIAVLIGLTAHMTIPERVKIAINSSALACAILIVAAIIGPLLFKLFRITDYSFQIAGGIYLALIGLDLLICKPTQGNTDEVKPSGGNIAITPLAMPLLAGPGTISFIFLLRSEIHDTTMLVLLCTGIFIAMAATFICFVGAAKASNKMSPMMLRLGERLTGLMVLCLGAQVIVSGITKAFFI